MTVLLYRFLLCIPGTRGRKSENPKEKKKREGIIRPVGARERRGSRGGATHRDEMWGSALRGEGRQKRQRR